EDGSVDDLSDLIISAVIADPVHTTSNALKNATQIIKAGAGTMELTAANTITGKTTISEGTLRLSGAGTFGTGEVLINEDGTLEFKNSTASSIPSAISGTGDILVSAGTANLTGAVNQTGGSTTLGNGATLNVGSAMLNDLAVTDGAAATLVASGNLTLNNDADTQFTGSITAPAIDKTGNGTLKLNSGDTGLINVTNLTVTGGRLDLKGNAKGGLTVGPNTVFSPGNSIGKADVDGTFTLSSDTSAVLMEIGGSAPDDNDLLIVSGDLALNNGKIYLELGENSTLNPGDEFIAVFHGNNSAALEDDFIANYVNAPDFMNLAYVQLDAGDYAGLYAITGAVFDIGAVPEPATWVLLLLGTAGLLYWRKK
nr:autotransporter-associated beta strand repeat-containing protein [Thermoguttaceae bacterium]